MNAESALVGLYLIDGFGASRSIHIARVGKDQKDTELFCDKITYACATTVHKLNDWNKNRLWRNSEKPFNNPPCGFCMTRQPKRNMASMFGGNVAIPLPKDTLTKAPSRFLFGCPVLICLDRCSIWVS